MPIDMSYTPTTSEVVIYHRIYGPALPSLNWIPAPRYLLRRDRVFRNLATKNPCRVLDIGCGPATILAELAAQGHVCVGVDRSEQALHLARHITADASMVTLRTELDPAWKESFDLILSFEVVEHLDDDLGALREWIDYLKPGGRLILSTPAHPSRWNAADVWAGHVRRYERAELVQTITVAGFVVEIVECYGFPLANVMEILRARTYGRALNSREKAGKSAYDLTDESGTDRSIEARSWRIFSSWPVSVAMRLFCQVQRPFLRTELGNGYLVIARKR